MEMSNKIFQTLSVDPVELEVYLNDLAEEGRWVLHSIHLTQMGVHSTSSCLRLLHTRPMTGNPPKSAIRKGWMGLMKKPHPKRGSRN